MLLRLQNRGQLSAGITTYNPQRQQLIDTFKKVGLVNEVFSSSNRPKFANIMKDYSGVKGIGHVRYSTFGADDEGYAQPFERHHNRMWKWFSFAFNGNIANYSDLKQELASERYHLIRDSDTELLMLLLSEQLKGDDVPQFSQVFSGLSEKLDGAYSMVFLNAEGELVALRDPLGIKPLCFSDFEGKLSIASESSALLNSEENGVKDVGAGEFLLVGGDNSFEVKKYCASKKKAHCMFEWVYFSNASSTIDGVNVYQTRWNLGKELAKAEPLGTGSGDFVVVPVPDTSRPAAEAFAHELGLPCMEGLLRNRYIGRTFIEGEGRSEKAMEKYSIVKPLVRGKRVLLVEDSIVRGTTGRTLINYVREKGGAREVHVRVSCPPVRFPCFYGIDMSSCTELIASRASSPEERLSGSSPLSEASIGKIRQEIGADSLVYNSVDSLVKAIGLPESELCLACLNSQYPTPKGFELLKSQLSNPEGSGKRAYEC